MTARTQIAHGNAFPFDASDAWWNDAAEQRRPKPTDWAHSAARGIIASLQDRAGIKHGLSTVRIDEATRAEIVGTLAEIIREAAKSARG